MATLLGLEDNSPTTGAGDGSQISTGPTTPSSVYWIGADGNTYVKTDAGVQNYGVLPQGSTIVGGTRIADPNAPTAPTAPPAPSYPALNQGAVDNTQIAIDQLPALLAHALANEDTSFQNALGGFDAQEKQQRGTYGTSTDTNQKNYDANFMDSIRAGIRGLGSLMNILRGTGAAGGTAEDQVRDTVGGVTSQDIRSGADTRDQNQSALDASLGTFLTDLKGKRDLAADTHANNESAIRRDNSTQLQDLYSKMAGYFGDAGMTGQRDAFMAKAGDLTPSIAKNSMTQTSRYDTTPVAIKAPQITAFAAPSQPNVAAVPRDGQVGTGIFTMSRKKDQQNTTPVALPVGA